MRKVRSPKLTLSAKLALRRANTDVHVHNQYKWSLLEMQKKDHESYKWSGNLSPSGFTFDMCMDTYFKTVGKHTEFPLKALMKISIGQGFHTYLGKIFKYHGHNLAPFPSPPNDPEPYDKRKWALPEVIFTHPEYHIRGKADLVPMIKKAPAIIDFKTTWLEDEEWEKFINDPVAKAQWLCQVATYAFVGNDLDYYDIPIARVGIVVINLKRDPDRDDAWKELYWDYDYDLNERVRRLLDALKSAYSEFKDNRPITCFNPECAKHGQQGVKTQTHARSPRIPSTRPDQELFSYQKMSKRKP